jgi:hypothetical protein
MDTPSPASSKAKSHRRQKLLRSNEITGKRRQRVASNQATTSPPTTRRTDTTTPSPSLVAVVLDVDSPPTVLLPNAVTPATLRGKKRTSGDQLIDRTHAIRRRKGIVLDDARILGFLREPFTSILKSSGKAMIDAKGLKRVAAKDGRRLF